MKAIRKILTYSFWTVVTLIFIIVFGSISTLDCYRDPSSKITCNLISDNLILGSSTHILSGLRSAQLDTSQSTSAEDSDTYRILILTSEGKIPIDTVYDSDKSKAEERINLINNYISDTSQKSLKIVEDRRWTSLTIIVFVTIFLALRNLEKIRAIFSFYFAK